MANKKLPPENERVVAVYDKLVASGAVKSRNDFCKKLPFNQSSFSKIEAGTRDVPPKLIQGLVRKFNVNEDYLLEGTLPIFKEKPETNDGEIKTPTNKTMEALKREVEMLRELLASEREKNATLKEMLEMYKGRPAQVNKKVG